MTKEEALKATKNGAIAACISAALTIVIFAIAIGTDASGALSLWNNPFTLLDIGLILSCAFGIYRHSRAASILMLVYFISAKFIIAAETKNFSSIFMSLIFVYFYAKAVQGSFSYHRIERETNPNYQSVSKTKAAFIGTAVFFVFVILAFALFSTFGVVPSTRVLAGTEVAATDIDLLRKNGVLEPNDEVEYFYSEGLTSVLESGSVLTKDYVIVYSTNEQNKIDVFALPIDEVVRVDLEQQGGPVSESVYVVRTKDADKWIRLSLSTEMKGDEKFIASLRDKAK